MCYLSGDYSINSLNNDKHIPTVYFLEYMSSNEYMQMINEPTRDAGGDTTLIDNNSMNTVPNESTLIGLFYADISDHYPIFYIERGRAPCDVHFWGKRVYSDKNIRKFDMPFAAVNWSSVIDFTDLRDNYSHIHCQLNILNITNALPHHILKETLTDKQYIDTIKKKYESWSKLIKDIDLLIWRPCTMIIR